MTVKISVNDDENSHNELASRRAAAKKRLVANADGYMQAKLTPPTAPAPTTRPP